MRAITEEDYTMEHALNTNIAAQYDVNIALLIQVIKPFESPFHKIVKSIKHKGDLK